MNSKGRQLVAVSASATSVAALEVLLVAAARRFRSVAGVSMATPGSARASHWAHLVLSEVLATLQAELVSRQLRVSVAVERALAEQKHASPLVPSQRGRSPFGKRVSASRPPVPVARAADGPSLVQRDTT
jgi:hypothetical protein